MRRYLLLLSCLLSLKAFVQPDTSKMVRGFPITSYMAAISDSIKVVQVYLPDGPVLRDKQLGLLRGMYRDKHSDTATVGMGRCNLIKGDYYYFTINYGRSGKLPKEGDLLYTMVDKPKTYRGQALQLAAHFIGLQSVYEKPQYDRYRVFNQWSLSDETSLMDSSIADIRFTADYFLTNSPEMNVKIKGGSREGQMVLNTMKECTRKDLTDFFNYIIARPRLYAGKEWKVSEIFATWLSEGAPTVVK